MNIAKAIYCRAFQQGFRIMYPFFPYRVPEALESDRDIPAKLNELGIRSALLVTNESLRSLGVTAPLERAMEEVGVACAVYDRTPGNPAIAHIE